jgi:NTP pyrophosphatase (non-canonical NTP hydrolase)
MTIQELTLRANEVRDMYADLESSRGGAPWTRLQLMQGFVGDVGDLTKLAMAKDGLRKYDDIDEKLEHEFADCLWSILVLAKQYDVDIEKSFMKTMDELTQRIQKETSNES